MQAEQDADGKTNR